MGITVQLNINVLEGQGGFSKQIDMIGDYPVVSFAPRFFDYNKLVMKRIIDIVGALVGTCHYGGCDDFPGANSETGIPGAFGLQTKAGREKRKVFLYLQIPFHVQRCRRAESCPDGKK